MSVKCTLNGEYHIERIFRQSRETMFLKLNIIRFLFKARIFVCSLKRPLNLKLQFNFNVLWFCLQKSVLFYSFFRDEKVI